jgi:DNA processing protein
MEAPAKSGALITARFANDFCRDVYAMPARVDDEKSQGCLRLLSQGAQQIVREVDELLKMLGAMPQLDVVETSNKSELTLPNLEPELKQVLEIIALESTPFDLIVQQTGYSTGSVSSALLQLELMGLVSQLPGMRYQRC